VALVNLSTREKPHGSLETCLCLLFPQKFFGWETGRSKMYKTFT